MWAGLQRFDAHPKTKDEFRVRTLQGGVVTLVAALLAMWLVRAELRNTFTVTTTDRLFVNSSHGASVSVSFAIDFPHVVCDLIAVDAMDQAGQPMKGVVQHVFKRPLGAGDAEAAKHAMGDTATTEEHFVKAACGNCYGAEDEESPCCATCDDVRRAYSKRGWTFHAHTVLQCEGESVAGLLKRSAGGGGCALEGDIELPAVAGNFHFAPGRGLAHAAHTTADLLALTFAEFDVSHTIRRLSFGHDGAADPKNAGPQRPDFDGQLDGQTRSVTDGRSMHQYYLKVVPTTYVPLSGPATPHSQYSVTEHQRAVSPGAGRGLPGVFFYYEVSPLCAEVVEARAGLGAFLTGLSAVVGGVVVTMGLVDRGLAHAADCFPATGKGVKHAILD
ncbi:endoplasmic reticulum vesicle transporter-domain-containing protein [Pelagophyceae sp. CCMP2097]|nr:endoplasmic reticulum vesicle transporter-domain-containing protein [Pelagophyceae sp. CCMP2097]